MADNITALANTGGGTDVLATDDIGGVHYPRTKLVIGADGVNGGDVHTGNPLPVGGTALAALLSTVYNHNDVFADGSPGLLMLGKRRDSDTTVVADGDLNTFNLDEEGRLKVSTKPASYPDITGDITAIQATIGTPVAGGTVSGDVSRASNIMIFCTGTFATINCTFEGSLEAAGETNWFAVQAVRSNANIIETTTGNLSGQPAYAWELSVNALKRFRVRCTARTSGTQSWRFTQGTYATEPIPAAQTTGTQAVSGTVTATVGTSITGGTISPLTVAGVSIVASGAQTGTGASAAQTNASGRGALFFVNVTAVSGTSPGLVVFFQAQDPVSGGWVTIPGAITANITATTGTVPVLLTVAPGLTAVANSIVNFPMPRTFRVAWTITGTTPSFTFSVGMAPVI